jgi:hypothetical protein
MLTEGGSSDQNRIRFGFHLVLARDPQPEELAILQRNLAFHRDYFATHADKAEKYLSQGESTSRAQAPLPEQAAYMALGNLLLNLDEAVVKE